MGGWTEGAWEDAYAPNVSGEEHFTPSLGVRLGSAPDTSGGGSIYPGLEAWVRGQEFIN